MDTSVGNLTLLASTLPLAQFTGLEMVEIYRGDASAIEDDSLGWSEELTLIEPYLEEASFEEFSGDVALGSADPSIAHTDLICTEPLDSTPISSLLLPTTTSHLHAFMSPQVTFKDTILALIHIVLT